MGALICATCHVTFSGRPNRRYCGPACKRKAEMQARERKRQAPSDALEPWGEPTDWGVPWEGCEPWEGGEPWTEEDWKSLPPW